jgi:hypothetical protein
MRLSRKFGETTVIQTVRDHTCLPQAGTSGIRLKLKIKGIGLTEKGPRGKDPREKWMRTFQGLIPYLE